MQREKRTYADRREYLIKAVSERRRKLKQIIVESKGGICFVCGYHRCVSAFDLHHIDESKKNFGFAEKGITRSQKTLLSEAEKCVLLCANCHRELHSGMFSIACSKNGMPTVELAKTTQI